MKMASNQLSNKRGQQAGQQTRSASRAEAGSRADFGSLSREAREKAEGYLEQGAEQFREMTRDHEGTAVVVALAAGFGIGLTIGCALASTGRRPRTWRDRLSAEGMGRHMLDRLEGMIPDALADYIRK
jgi:hypothetical protein